MQPQGSSAVAGFTLTEALIAGTIAAIALTGVGRAMIMGQRSATMARRQLEAVHNARAAMESITQSDFHGSALSLGRKTLTNGFYDVTSVDTRTKNVELRVRWLSPRGATNWVTLTTSVSSAVHY